MTLQDFLAWEETQELRYEFDGVQPLAMNGGTLAHEMIGGNLRAALHEKLRGKRCRPLGPSLKIEVDGCIRYPDAFVHCGPVAPKTTAIHDPVVVFEVVSPSSSRIDRIVKLREYQATSSIQRYVIIEQDSIAATILTRQGAFWSATAVTGDALIEMPEIEVTLVLSDLYEGLDLPPSEEDER